MNAAGRGRAAPAAIWRAFFILLASAAARVLAGPPGAAIPPDFAPIGPADQAAAQEVLQRFRDPAAVAPYYFEFQLREIPRRGDERAYLGRLWGARNEEGLILRIALIDGGGREHRFLLQNGVHARGWIFAGGRLEPLDAEALGRPVIAGVEVTPFDLQMPFLYWADARLTKLTRVLGRPADEFLFRAPAGFSPDHFGPAAVLADLDTQFGALVRTELVGADGSVGKTLSLVDLKKIGMQWIPKEVDVRNESTRDKTRISMTAAALGLDLSPALFLPEQLGEDVPAPAGKLLVQLPP